MTECIDIIDKSICYYVLSLWLSFFSCLKYGLNLPLVTSTYILSPQSGCDFLKNFNHGNLNHVLLNKTKALLRYSGLGFCSVMGKYDAFCD